MKNAPTPNKPASGDKETAGKTSSRESEELKTPHPLSEKDEIKEAERKLNEKIKK